MSEGVLSGDPARSVEMDARCRNLTFIALSSISVIHEFVGSPRTHQLNLDAQLLREMVLWHYERADEYREEEEFPRGRRIDFPKVAAYTALWILKYRPITVVGDPDTIGEDFASANPLFAFLAFLGAIKVPLGAVPILERQWFMRALVDVQTFIMDNPWQIFRRGDPSDQMLWSLFFELLVPTARRYRASFEV